MCLIFIFFFLKLRNFFNILSLSPYFAPFLSKLYSRYIFNHSFIELVMSCLTSLVSFIIVDIWKNNTIFRNKSETLPVTTNCNIVCLAVAPDGYTAILVDESKDLVALLLLKCF